MKRKHKKRYTPMVFFMMIMYFLFIFALGVFIGSFQSIQMDNLMDYIDVSDISSMSVIAMLVTMLMLKA